MTEQEKSTEEVIFDAAQIVFVQKGFDGARMQEIAQVAGINKALLHYYYRTKEKLFNAIFDQVLEHFVPKVIDFIDSDKSVLEKIEFFVETYIDILLKNPFIPHFVINEINRNPEHIAEMLGKHIVKTEAFQKWTILLKQETEKGTIRKIEPEQLFVNMLALCVFPFVARPIIQGVFLITIKKGSKLFLKPEKKEVATFIINSIKIEKSESYGSSQEY